MESLRHTLKTLFLHKNPDAVLGELYDKVRPKHSSGYADTCVDKDWFIAAFNNDEDCFYTKDQIGNYYNLANSKWMKGDNGSNQYSFSKGTSVFNVILQFATQVLTELNCKPVCKYEHLLRWHDISASLTEDLFTTAYLASKDLRDISQEARYRKFSWRDNIDHDNHMINLFCKKRMVDVHYHLWGSTFVFDLNWLSLMNDVSNRKTEFEKLDEYLDPLYTLFQSEKHSTMFLLVMKAAAIRICLFYNVFSNDVEVCRKVYQVTEEILKAKDDLLMSSALRDLNSLIQSTKYIYGRKIARQIDSKNINSTKQVWDYAINSSLTNPCEGDMPFYVLSGERGLMYHLFRKLYGGEKDFVNSKLPTLFYVYILIKNIFRHELVQLNKSIGFKNFSDYQDRKSTFIRCNSIWDEISAECALGSSIVNENRYVEARICPKRNVHELNNSIRYVVDSVPQKYQNNFGFVMHFIKGANKCYALGRPRHSELRQTIKQQAHAINELRKIPSIGQWIVGVDAANSEILCPPEVFAPTYRFLRQQARGYYYMNSGNELIKKVGFTFHAGEDFLDIVCGLRAVEETLLFLQIGNGDRLGHALVLGTDVKKYYEQRHYHVSMPMHDIFDNIVWLLVRADKYVGYEKVRQILISGFEKYRRIIYEKCISSHKSNDKEKLYVSQFSVHDFYQAWLLRGDDPSYYDSEGYKKKEFQDGIMSLTAINDDYLCVEARKNRKACKLFFLYHYSELVKSAGKETDEVILPKEITSIIIELQKEILCMVEKRHIAIECNPTSNYRIGEIDYYKNHPMLHFYNHGIDHEGTASHAISVSINTDDKGVFATSQDREFAVIAAALEKLYKNEESTNPPRVIYEWLDHIREMGFEQTFLEVQE